jgi:CheY-like chemotaxis protein
MSILNKHKRSTVPGSILVVDDDRESRSRLRRVLERPGWDVQEAAQGHAALACVARKPPQLILLDLLMPEMDGLEFVRQLRQMPLGASIPVVIVTAKELTGDERTSLHAHGARIFNKGDSTVDRQLREVGNLLRDCIKRKSQEGATS